MIVVSNRGPSRFERAPDGSFTARRGSGGLVGALEPALRGDAVAPHEPRTWIAVALTDDDRAAARADKTTVDGLHLALLDLDPETVHQHYDVIANGVLWPLHHGLFDLTRTPSFGPSFHHAWDAYRAVNDAFAAEIVRRAAPGETVLVHDYHCALVPGLVRAARPDIRLAHFTHTPCCGPNSARVLPTVVAEELFASMASAPAGFHSGRWADAFRASVRTILGPDVDAPVFIAPLGPDGDALAAVATSPAAIDAGRDLDRRVGDRRLILRTDRVDPAKNLVRGFRAFDLLLDRHPEWCGAVVFVAMLNRSREGTPDYVVYRDEVERTVADINDRRSTSDWAPIVLDLRDDYAASIAGLQRYDVLLVNSVKDGLNLVAKEGPLVNTRDGVVCLSPETGAFDELADAVIATHPFDLVATAEALHHALTLDPAARAALAVRLRVAAGRATPTTWLATQLAHAEPSDHADHA